MGDFLLTLPVFQAVRAQYPQAQLAALTGPAVGGLAEHCGVVGEARNLDDASWASFFVKNGELDPKASEWLATFDCVISFLHDSTGAWRENVVRATKAQFFAGESNPGDFHEQHASTSLLAILQLLGITRADPLARLLLPDPPLTTNAIALHPGSGSETKNWPEQKWMELIETWLGQNRSLRVIGGEAEAGRLERIQVKFKDDQLIVIQNQPLTVVARALAGCSGFVGHDSGITHLAAALGVNCVALWADTNETVWRPLGDHVKIVREEKGIAAIEPKRVEIFFKK